MLGKSEIWIVTDMNGRYLSAHWTEGGARGAIGSDRWLALKVLMGA